MVQPSVYSQLLFNQRKNIRPTNKIQTMRCSTTSRRGGTGNATSSAYDLRMDYALASQDDSFGNPGWRSIRSKSASGGRGPQQTSRVWRWDLHQYRPQLDKTSISTNLLTPPALTLLSTLCQHGSNMSFPALFFHQIGQKGRRR